MHCEYLTGSFLIDLPTCTLWLLLKMSVLLWFILLFNHFLQRELKSLLYYYYAKSFDKDLGCCTLSLSFYFMGFKLLQWLFCFRRRDENYCHFVIFVSFCFSCDSGNICRSVNIPKNAGKFTLITATWLMHCCDLFFSYLIHCFFIWPISWLSLVNCTSWTWVIGSLIDPTLKLLRMCVYMC